LETDIAEALRAFRAQSGFDSRGGVMTDLDGTAVLEAEGRVFVAPAVELGLKRLRDRGRPVAVNTLRFPLNVVRTFGRAWSAVSDAPLPLVSLNGAVTGHIVESASGRVGFEELDAVPLEATEIEEVLEGVRGLTEAGIDELLLFHYPRSWAAGERIWTPDPTRIGHIAEKYRSASDVLHDGLAGLRARLLEEEHCMLFLLVEAPQDRLMAYQHARPTSFVTHAGVDKLAGALRLAELLDFDLDASVGAGDTPMDSFLGGCGMAVQVGPVPLEHRGRHCTLRVEDPAALGMLLHRLAEPAEQG
jgi:hydroxymethylpyrimidine pyrophosphatase-like HAD family hydrolase